MIVAAILLPCMPGMGAQQLASRHLSQATRATRTSVEIGNFARTATHLRAYTPATKRRLGGRCGVATDGGNHILLARRLFPPHAKLGFAVRRFRWDAV